MILRILRFPLIKLILTLAGSYGLTLALAQVLQTLKLFDDATLTAVSGALATALVLWLAERFLEPAPRPLVSGGQPGRQLGLGFGLGTLLMGACMGLALLLGGYQLVDSAGASPAALLSGLVLFGAVAVFEENLLRGMLLRYTEELIGSWLALLLTSLLFGLAHLLNPAATLFGALAIALEAGVLLGASYVLTRRLWLAYGIHWAWNFVQVQVFGAVVSGNDLTLPSLLKVTPTGSPLISGGEFGIEASVISIILCLAAGIWLLRRAVRAGALRPPFWRRRRL